MRRQATAELYRKHIEDQSLRNIAGIVVLFMAAASIVLFTDHQSQMDAALAKTNLAVDAQAQLLAQMLAGKMGRLINYLNRTAKLPEQQPIEQLCDTMKAICERDGSPLAQLVSTTYRVQQVIYMTLCDSDLQPQPFFYNTTSRELLILTFSLPMLKKNA